MSNERINKILKSEKQLSYEECRQLWEDKNTLVHHDTSESLIKSISDHIIQMCELTDEDILLNIGCGDGLFDYSICRMEKPFMESIFLSKSFR